MPLWKKCDVTESLLEQHLTLSMSDIRVRLVVTATGDKTKSWLVIKDGTRVLGHVHPDALGGYFIVLYEGEYSVDLYIEGNTLNVPMGKSFKNAETFVKDLNTCLASVE